MVDGKREREGASLPIFPLPIVPLMLFFPLTPVPLGNKEASAEERGIQAKITMTRAELNKQLVKENTTKTLYNGGALSCHARQIDSYYFIIATRQAREKKR